MQTTWQSEGLRLEAAKARSRCFSLSTIQHMGRTQAHVHLKAGNSFVPRWYWNCLCQSWSCPKQKGNLAAPRTQFPSLHHMEAPAKCSQRSPALSGSQKTGSLYLAQWTLCRCISICDHWGQLEEQDGEHWRGTWPIPLQHEGSSSCTLQGDMGTYRLWFDGAYYTDIVLISLDPKHLEWKNWGRGGELVRKTRSNITKTVKRNKHTTTSGLWF